eukprot:3533460-Ditylum_brightwellii.AAC.1
MSTYQQVVSCMFMFETDMPPDMPIEAVALGTWRIYMGQLAMKTKNTVIKIFEEHHVVLRGPNKSKPSARFFINIMKN